MNRLVWLEESICVKVDGKYIWKGKWDLNYNEFMYF